MSAATPCRLALGGWPIGERGRRCKLRSRHRSYPQSSALPPIHRSLLCLPRLRPFLAVMSFTPVLEKGGWMAAPAIDWADRARESGMPRMTAPDIRAFGRVENCHVLAGEGRRLLCNARVAPARVNCLMHVLTSAVRLELPVTLSPSQVTAVSLASFLTVLPPRHLIDIALRVCLLVWVICRREMRSRWAFSLTFLPPATRGL